VERWKPSMIAVAACLLAIGLAVGLASTGGLSPRLGPADGLPARFLRLAGAAALTLPALAWLYTGLADGPDTERRVVLWGRWMFVGGALGMPILLAAAAVGSVQLKYLLLLPADAIFAGTLVGAWLAGRRAHALEAWGWRLVAAGMGLGLLLGTFAFEGPLTAPHFLADYTAPARRALRSVHVGAILLGMAGIAAGRARLCRQGCRSES
jgi:hypothetical protein